MKKLQLLLAIFKQFSNNIRLQCGLDKCTKAIFTKSKMTGKSNANLDQQNVIKELEPVEKYK